jgi:polynucleotide 5'-kinase involved in rRNA processing
MLPTLVGAKHLVELAQQEEIHTIVYDTSGFVDPSQGGLALKSAKIDLLRPSVIFAFQREQELEPLLRPLRGSGRARVVDLKPSGAVIPRNPEVRRRHRAQQFANHFAGAKCMNLDWTKIAVFPVPVFRLNQLVALEDQDGFALALGIVQAIDRSSKCMSLFTKFNSITAVNALHLGDILLDAATFQDERIR